MRTKLKPIQISMFRTSAGRFVRVVYRCDCRGSPHAFHWRFDFPVSSRDTIGTCDEASACLTAWAPDELLFYGTFEFMERRAARVAQHFLTGE